MGKRTQTKMGRRISIKVDITGEENFKTSKLNLKKHIYFNLEFGKIPN